MSRPAAWSGLDHFLGVDIFQRVIEMASQAISMIYNPVAAVCQRTHVSVKA